jgi:hypothetical protein
MGMGSSVRPVRVCFVLHNMPHGLGGLLSHRSPTMFFLHYLVFDAAPRQKCYNKSGVTTLAAEVYRLFASCDHTNRYFAMVLVDLPDNG